MKIISTATHAFIDYFIALILLAGPSLMGFAPISPESSVFVITGISVIISSVLTKHELGALKIIPMPIHFWTDVIAGIFLCVSPWLFDFDHRVFIPHLMIGMFEITLFFFTQTIFCRQESNSE